KGDGVPGGGIIIDSEMSFTSHTYKNEMYVKTTTLLPFAPPTAVEVAAFDGAIYIKDPSLGIWTMAGAYDPENIAEASAYTGIQGMNGMALQEEMLGTARIAGVESVQVGGEKALRVTVDLANVGFEEALQQFSATDLLPESGASMSATVDRFLVIYVVHPETGFIFQTNLDLAVTLDVSDATGSGQIDMVLTGSAAAHRTTEPVQFPSDLTK
ncbi:MAG: hypothetical protein K0R39_3595, partial [Symbiobacteriaceae bacterium]|nr:hypothetical protein [Symbiobacteriaceae bacterium]